MMKYQGGGNCVLFFVGGLSLAAVAAFWRHPAVLLGGLGVGMLLGAVAAGVITLARCREGAALDASADINNAAFDIRSTFGAKAQREFLEFVSEPSRPGANTNECRFRPGQNRQTMAAKAQEIRGKYKPVSEWKPRN